MDKQYELVEVAFKDLAMGMSFLRKSDNLEYEKIDFGRFNAGGLEHEAVAELEGDEVVLIPRITRDAGKPYSI